MGKFGGVYVVSEKEFKEKPLREQDIVINLVDFSQSKNDYNLTRNCYIYFEFYTRSEKTVKELMRIVLYNGEIMRAAYNIGKAFRENEDCCVFIVYDEDVQYLFRKTVTDLVRGFCFPIVKKETKNVYRDFATYFLSLSGRRSYWKVYFTREKGSNMEFYVKLVKRDGLYFYEVEAENYLTLFFVYDLENVYHLYSDVPQVSAAGRLFELLLEALV